MNPPAITTTRIYFLPVKTLLTFGTYLLLNGPNKSSIERLYKLQVLSNPFAGNGPLSVENPLNQDTA